MNKSNAARYLFPGIGCVLVISLIILWYKPLSYHVFIGDDLAWIRTYNAGFAARGFWHSIFAMGQDLGKFRPVSNALILLSTELCGNRYGCYVRINCAILLLNAVLISVGAYLVSTRWWPSAVIAALALIVSRFAYYAIFEVMGLMENLSLTFVLLFAVCGIQFVMSGGHRWLALQILFYVLALLSHERFIVLMVPLLLLCFLECVSLQKAGFYASLVAIFLATATYLIIKQFVFQDSIFAGTQENSVLTGTQETSVLSTFRVSQFISFMGQGFLNLIGFNMGPRIWSGAQFTDVGVGGFLVGILLSGGLVILVVTLIRQKSLARSQIQLEALEFLVVTIAVLLVSASITVRQEFRWLYAPFVVFILLVCLLLRGLPNPTFRLVMAVILSIAFTAVDVFYRPFINKNFGFMSGARMASIVKTEILDKSYPYSLSTRTIYIVTNGDPNTQHWTLADDYFFQLYYPTRVDVRYVSSLEALPMNIFQEKQFIVYQILRTRVASVTSHKLQQLLQEREPPSGGKVEFDLVDDVPAGVVNGPLPAEPPTGNAPFVADWKNAAGVPSRAIALTTASSLRFSSIMCAATSHLRFRAGMPYVNGDGADLSVYIQRQGITDMLAQMSFKQARVNRAVTWSDYDLPISDCTGGPIDVIFLVDSPSPNTVNDMIVVADIELVLPE